MTISDQDRVRLHQGIEYPFPLSDGALVWLRVPGSGGLTDDDVARMSEWLKTLVVPAKEEHE